MVYYLCLMFMSGLRWEFLAPMEVVFICIRVGTDVCNGEVQMQPITTGANHKNNEGAYYLAIVTTITELIVELAFLFVARQLAIKDRHFFLSSKRLQEAHIEASVEVNPFRLTSLRQWFQSTSPAADSGVGSGDIDLRIEFIDLEAGSGSGSGSGGNGS